MSNKTLTACAHEMSLGHSNEISAPFYGHVIELIRLLIAKQVRLYFHGFKSPKVTISNTTSLKGEQGAGSIGKHCQANISAANS